MGIKSVEAMASGEADQPFYDYSCFYKDNDHWPILNQYWFSGNIDFVSAASSGGKSRDDDQNDGRRS
ncbi:MAG: hypothetical protein ACR2G5_03770 [Pyrinomonadaceae bacterium]